MINHTHSSLGVLHLVLLSFLTFAACSGEDASKTSSQGAQTSQAATTAGRRDAGGGQEVFVRCAACHQATGQGVPGTYPPLAGSEWAMANPEVPIRIVLYGLHGPITVRGTSFDNVMIPFGGILSDAEIASVLTHVRSQWGNTASAITAEQVAKVRAATAGRTAPWTPDELRPFLSAQ